MRIRSVLVTTLAVIALAFGGMARISAQESPLAAAGYPELAITLTDAGLEGVPAETAAGWYFVSFTNSASSTGDPFEDSWAVDFVLVPEGMTADDVAAAFSGPPPGAEGEASPESMEGMDMGSPAADAAPADPTAFMYETYLPGGPGALPGETGQAAIFLQPGNYAVLTIGLTPAVPMTVTGEADPLSGTVTADSTVTESGTTGEFDFAGALPEGQGVLEIYNDSDQPHFVFGIHSDTPITEEEVMALLAEEEEPPADAASPAADAASPAAGPAEGPPVTPAFITGVQSPETTQYIGLDLEPGYYILLCFVGDPNNEGLPHAFGGMIEIIPVGVDGATPAA